MPIPRRLVPLALAVLVTGCGTDDPAGPQAPAVDAVQVVPQGVALSSRGESVQLQATALDGDATAIAGKSFSWSSSDPESVSVSATGLATALDNGSATITATSDGVDGSTTVSVEQVVDAVSVSPADPVLTSIGESVALTADAIDANSSPIAGLSFDWTSSDEGVATVDPDGVVTAVTEGSATITATTDGVDGETVVTVQLAAGTALGFDGANDFAVIPADLAAMGITTAFTISVWVKAPAAGGMQMLLEDGTQFNTDAFYLGVRPDVDRIFARLNTANGSVFNDGIVVPPFADEWTHLALIYDGASFTAYFNGAPVYQPAITGEIRDGNRGLRIGFPSGENFYAGEVDELRVWNEALSEAELQATMASPLTGSEPGLVGLWSFDEGQGQSFADDSGNGRNGTLGATTDADDDDPAWLASTAPLGDP